MLFLSSGSKFHYDGGSKISLKIASIFIVLLVPSILLQVPISDANISTTRFAQDHIKNKNVFKSPEEVSNLEPSANRISESYGREVKRDPDSNLVPILEVEASTPSSEESIDRIDRDEDVTLELEGTKVPNVTVKGADGSRLVLVSSKSGKFRKLLPLNDLLVSPLLHEPHNRSLQKPIALDASSNSPKDGDINTNKDLAALHSYHLEQQEQLDVQQRRPKLEAEASVYERMPDSFEGLMNLGETEDESDSETNSVPVSSPKHSSAPSNRIGRGSDSLTPLDSTQTGPFEQSSPNNKDQDDDEDLDEQNDSPEVPEERRVINTVDNGVVSTNNRQTVEPIREFPKQGSGRVVKQTNGIDSDERQVMGTGIHPTSSKSSAQDLRTAAGHHYKKKKKKYKIVIKKKKKKKKKKVKKIKYKKKKKIIIKKKKKKHSHPKKHHHAHDHGKYYMYAKVPKKKSWEFGFKKGNKKHWIERHEKGHKNRFKTKVKWYDKKSKGKGLHVWDYNHHDKKKKKKHYG